MTREEMFNYEDQTKEYSDLILRKYYDGKLDKPTSIRLIDKIIEWGEEAERKAADE